ncbi:YolD-like family protein [Bacillus cereus]|uniref:YolD-like family protein n=1 Tax=Bacillus thuringiensis TaxID=1428 RepID=A0AB35PM40_BACTU|nr:YolD-like family protein [Bacillus thuringiensis]KAB2400657.1 YolD-like family protein [Bacillus cereus]KAB2416820.1 YolD-like family protein [Bacillus cereus]KAB2435873.1 YolD-like family protein [Bacillus cereus]KAB2467815.1 YolD-like family protein [Bacillus cereus]
MKDSSGYYNVSLYKNYITVADINPLNKTITCIDAFHNQRMFKFGDIIEVNSRG